MSLFDARHRYKHLPYILVVALFGACAYSWKMTFWFLILFIYFFCGFAYHIYITDVVTLLYSNFTNFTMKTRRSTRESTDLLGQGKSSAPYCKSTNFGVLLYLANCVFSLIFVAPTYVNYVDRTLHRLGDAKFNSRQITLFWEMPNLIATKICWFTVLHNMKNPIC